jgi:uncharacterized damage-inducible protein DinB
VTVRHLALQLYHWMKRLEELEQARAKLTPETPLAEHTRLEGELTEARRQVEHFHKLLEAQKEKVEI